MTTDNEGAFKTVVTELNKVLKRTPDHILESLIVKQLAKTLTDSGELRTKITYLTKFKDFLKVFDESKTDDVTKDLGITFEKALDLFLEKYDLIKAWLAIPQDGVSNPYFEALKSFLQDSQKQEEKTKSLEAIVYLKGIRYLDVVLDLDNDEQRQYSATEISNKMEIIVELYNVIERNIKIPLEPDLRRQFDGVLGLVTGRKIKILTLGIYEKTRQIADKNHEILSLEEDLKDLEAGQEDYMLREGEYKYDTVMQKILKEKFEARSKAVMEENINLIKNLLNSPDYVEYRDKIAELNKTVMENVNSFNSILLQIRKNLSNPLMISERDYNAAKNLGIDIDGILNHSEVDFDEFVKISGDYKKIIAKHAEKIKEYIEPRIKEEELITPNGEFSQLLALIEKWLNPPALGKSLLPVECMFLSNESEIFAELCDKVMLVGRRIAEDQIPADNIFQLRVALKNLLPARLQKLEKALETSNSPDIANEVVFLQNHTSVETLDDFSNEYLLTIASQGGLSAGSRGTIQKLASAKYVINKNNYNLVGVTQIRTEIQNLLEQYRLMLEVKDALVHVGKYLAALDPTDRLPRQLAAFDLDSLPDFLRVLDEWVMTNRARFVTWNKASYQTVLEQVDDIKALVAILGEKLKNERYAVLRESIIHFPLK